MNFKKTWKRFFSLSRRSDGFTLVELIVVIAILAILGGVAVPAYSGYVEKAEYAADEQLLAAVNTAFAAACAENGTDVYNVPETPKITLSGDAGAMTVGESAITAPASYNEAFQRYFAGNNSEEFKVIEKLQFVNGAFVDAAKAGGIFAQIFNSLDLDTLVAAVNGSTFGEIGAEGLLTKMDDVTGLAAALLAGATEGSAAESLKLALSADYATIAASMGMSETELETLIAGQEDPNAYYNNLLSNYAVLQVANTTSGKKTADLIADLQKGSSKNEIVTMLASGENQSSKEGVAKAAMMYAMYTSYANQLEDGDAKNKALANLTDISTFANAVESETQQGTGFMNYLDTQQATNDMDGFLASMNIITSSTKDNTEATQNLLENGYGDPDLIAALQGLLG